MTSNNKNERVIALIGPYLSGKTSVMESALCLSGAAHHKGEGVRVVGDTAAEAKDREMGVELNAASCEFMGDRYTFLDCPGSVELIQETHNAVMAADAAVIVIEPDPSKIPGMAPLMRLLEVHNLPTYVFVNKIDKAHGSVRELAEALKAVCTKPIVLRHLPIRTGEEITGYVDLASERAFVYSKGEPSKIVDLPEGDEDRIEEARYTMLEAMADFDDQLMEELLEDVHPPSEEVLTDLAKDVQQALLVPVMMGSALSDNGVFRLMKALRHELGDLDATLERMSAADNPAPALGQVLKTYHTPHGGKLSLVRVLKGGFKDGDTINGERVSGLYRLTGDKQDKLGKAEAGEVVAFGRLEQVRTGDTVSAGQADALSRPEVMTPVYGLAVRADNRNDEVKLSTSLAKITDEDPSIFYKHSEDTNELVLWGQGQVHIQIAIDRLKNKYGLSVSTQRPQVPYKETIRKGKTQHSRFKKQTGGHGQFGDVVIDVKPLPPGTGFSFEETIHGGSIPRQYIPSVETGIKQYLERGPLGFPVVDVGVTLTDGKYHAVDSSDMAFQTAGRLAMSEALPECGPVLLEPVMHVRVHVPSEFTARVNGLISTRRGQILGFDARGGWPGWDTVEANMPQSEMHDMIVELRSMTLGAGTFEAEYAHLAELTGRLADQVLESHKDS